MKNFAEKLVAKIFLGSKTQKKIRPEGVGGGGKGRNNHSYKTQGKKYEGGGKSQSGGGRYNRGGMGGENSFGERCVPGGKACAETRAQRASRHEGW